MAGHESAYWHRTTPPARSSENYTAQWREEGHRRGRATQSEPAAVNPDPMLRNPNLGGLWAVSSSACARAPSTSPAAAQSVSLCHLETRSHPLADPSEVTFERVPRGILSSSHSLFFFGARRRAFRCAC